MIYNKTTKELFGKISFVSPLSLFKKYNKDVKIKRMKNYFYFFPQKNHVWHSTNIKRGIENKDIFIYFKHKTLYWFWFWQIIVTHSRGSNNSLLCD